MPKNDDGEFELIFGNRQLLAVLFTMVILLAVFFSLGYVVGSSPRPAAAEVGANSGPNSEPATAAATSKAQDPVAVPVRTDTEPQKPVAAAQDAGPEPEKTDRESALRTRPEALRPAPGFRPDAGQTYLQLAATSRHEADILVDVLRKKSFKALAAEIEEKPGTFRVLVGPVTDTTANKTRADLQGAGFPGNAAIRRTF